SAVFFMAVISCAKTCGNGAILRYVCQYNSVVDLRKCLNSSPLLAEEGWLRHQLKVAKPPKAPQTGAKRERDSAKPNSGQLGEIFRPEQFRRTDHPGRAVSERIHFYLWRSHPSAARRGISKRLCLTSPKSPC